MNSSRGQWQHLFFLNSFGCDRLHIWGLETGSIIDEPLALSGIARPTKRLDIADRVASPFGYRSDVIDCQSLSRCVAFCNSAMYAATVVSLQRVEPLFYREMRFAVCRPALMPSNKLLKTNFLDMVASILSLVGPDLGFLLRRFRLAVGQDACLTARVEPRAGRLITVKLRN